MYQETVATKNNAMPPVAIPPSVRSGKEKAKPILTRNWAFQPLSFRIRGKITSEKIPTMSLCIDESELQKFGIDYIVGDYCAWSHFQSIDRIENKQFVGRIQKKYGSDYTISDAMEAAYFGVYLWKQAVTKAHTINTANVQTTLKNQGLNIL